MVVLTDVTKAMKLEKENKIIKTHLFASIAHELRTPLNSIIPLVGLVIEILSKHQSEESINKALKYLKIVSNNTIHLQNVIGDAIDINSL